LELPSTLPDRSWLAVACFLVDHGAELDAVDIRGNTPVSHVNNDAVIQLLRKRARFYATRVYVKLFAPPCRFSTAIEIYCIPTLHRFYHYLF